MHILSIIKILNCIIFRLKKIISGAKYLYKFLKLFQTTGPWAFVHVAFPAEKRTGTQQAAAEVGQRSGR